GTGCTKFWWLREWPNLIPQTVSFAATCSIAAVGKSFLLRWIIERCPEHLLDARCAGRQHDEPVDAERNPRRFRHMGKSGKEILVDRIALAVTMFFLGHFLFQPPALLDRIGHFTKTVGELDAANINLETLGKPRIARGFCQCRERGRIFIEYSGTAKAQIGLDPLHQYAAENIGPAIIFSDADACFLRRAPERFAIRCCGG